MPKDCVESSQRIASLDGLRAISITLVLLSHLAGTRFFLPENSIRALGDLGNLGVRVFFVISGFLITTLLLREHARSGTISVRGFFVRRAFRILPAFLAFLLVLLLANHLGVILLRPGDAVRAITFTTNFHSDRSWEVGHLWSLAVEEQFYILWPLVVLVAGPARLQTILMAVLALSPVLRVAIYVGVPEWRPLIGEAFPTVMDAIAAGCLLAVAGDRFWTSDKYRAILASHWFWGVVPLLIGLNWLRAFPSLSLPMGESLLNLGIAGMVHRVVQLPFGFSGAVLNAPALVYIGKLSYSAYLWQQLFLNRGSDAWPAAFPINVLVALAAASVSYHVIEVPALRMRNSAQAAWFRRERIQQVSPA